MSKLDKEEVIANFSAAYVAANGKEPQIEAKGGWYSVDGGKNVRLATLVDLIAELSGGAAPTAATEEKASVEKAAKKVKKPKAAAPANSDKGPKVVSAGGGLKPSDLWKERLENSAQKCALPRGI